MAGLPPRLHAQFYDVFGIELLYFHHLRQVTIHAAITTAAPPPPSSASAATCPGTDCRAFKSGTQPRVYPPKSEISGPGRPSLRRLVIGWTARL